MLMVSKITPRQVVSQLTKGECLAFVDACADEGAEQVPGAVRVRPQSVTRDAAGLSRNCPVVVYGAHDADPTAARVAAELRVLGFGPVRLLDGGLAAWRDHHVAVQAKDVKAQG